MFRSKKGTTALEWIITSAIAVLVLGAVVYNLAQSAGALNNVTEGVVAAWWDADGVEPLPTFAPVATSTAFPTSTRTPTMLPSVTPTLTFTPTFTASPTFTATPTFTPSLTPTNTSTPTPSTVSIEYLVVGGGGGGGYGNGGRGGTVRTGTLSLAPGTYTVTVGAGGAPAASGGFSAFNTITSTGGTGYTYTAGTVSNFTGSTTTYGVGGAGYTLYGGGWNCSMAYAASGAPYTGNGGDSSDARADPDGNVAYWCTPGSGGAGIVAVRYITGSLTATGATTTTTNGYTVHRFFANGTFTIVAP